MMLFKIIGAFLIVSCGFVFGMSEKGKFHQKISIIEGILTAIDLIYSEISCMCTPTEELLEKLRRIDNDALKNFFKDCKARYTERRDLPFSLIWSRAIKEAVYLGLSQNEESTLTEVGNALGRYSADEQLRVLEHARKRYEGYLKNAENAKQKLSKLYGNLSLISGIALVIILL